MGAFEGMHTAWGARTGQEGIGQLHRGKGYKHIPRLYRGGTQQVRKNLESVEAGRMIQEGGRGPGPQATFYECEARRVTGKDSDTRLQNGCKRQEPGQTQDVQNERARGKGYKHPSPPVGENTAGADRV